MARTSQISPESGERSWSILAEDDALSFKVQRSGASVYVERLQPLAGMGKLSHVMRFDDLDAFDRAYEADTMRLTYPHVYWRLRQAVEQVLQG
jgi:hypothetical protein